MNIETVSGIVLSSRLANEADSIATVFTESYGKADFIMKGLKKSKKRHLMSSSPGTVISFSFYHNEHRRVLYIHDIAVTDAPLHDAASYEQILNGHYLLESVRQTSAEREVQTFVYRLLHSALSQQGLRLYPYHLSLFFTVHLLRYHGILPFRSCKNKELTVAGRAFPLTETMEHCITESIQKKFSEIDWSCYKTDEIQELLFTLIMYMEEYYHIEFKTKRLLFHTGAAARGKGECILQ